MEQSIIKHRILPKRKLRTGAQATPLATLPGHVNGVPQSFLLSARAEIDPAATNVQGHTEEILIDDSYDKY
ncbi:MAG: hypothetical protein WBD27_04685 [Pyrinomonadaceae bacterium]